MNLNKYITLAATNPDKYPMRMGQPWDTDEENKLLDLVKRNTDVREIALEFQRSVGGITSRLKVIAVQLHNKGTPVEQITEKTGLSLEEISDAIERRDNVAKKPKNKSINNKDAIIEVLKQVQQIQEKLLKILENS